MSNVTRQYVFRFLENKVRVNLMMYRIYIHIYMYIHTCTYILWRGEGWANFSLIFCLVRHNFPHVAVSIVSAKGFLLLLLLMVLVVMVVMVVLLVPMVLVVLVVPCLSLLIRFSGRVAAPFSHNLIQWWRCHSNGVVIATAFVKERKVISDS